MGSPNVSNAAASVKARLLNLSRQKSRPFQELLQYYGMERFLFRLGMSRYADRFVLKRALLLHVWDIQDSRATRDIDMLAMVERELLNSRVKDYYDVWMLFRWGQFDQQTIGQALTRTFERRGTRLDLAQMLETIHQYGQAADRQLLWERYYRKGGLEAVPKALAAICDGIADVLKSL